MFSSYFDVSRPRRRRPTRLVSIPVWLSPYFSPPETISESEHILFQSRSGFSPTSTPVGRGQRVVVDDVSIPVWVFSLLRQPEPDDPGVALRWFQSRSGFFPCFGAPARRRTVDEAVVSIPVRVFSLLRRDQWLATRLYYEFQSRSGFLPASAHSSMSWQIATVAFQSRSGFSPCFGSRLGNPGRGEKSGFNPGLGFLPASAVGREDLDVDRGISIPFWVFSLSRPVANPPG